jgi:shikimate 5-dehydrogenase
MVSNSNGEVLIVGTGGAARAAIVAAKTAFSETSPSIQLFGRDEVKVKELCDEFSIDPWQPKTDSENGVSRRVVIACIPGSAQAELLYQIPTLVNPNDHIIEMAYIPRETPFSGRVKSVTYGWEILVEQGIAQHELWLGEITPIPVLTPNYDFIRSQIDTISSSLSQ